MRGKNETVEKEENGVLISQLNYIQCSIQSPLEDANIYK